MAIPLINPELQWVDADGNPYAGGTVGTYVPGTTTPKSTWFDMEGTAFNSNPVVLDAAGRAKIYGDGDYRLIVHDAGGQLVFDAETTSIVSVAMQPVVSAPTVAAAASLLGIEDWSSQIAAETARAEAKEADLGGAINAEHDRAVTAEDSIATGLSQEVTNRTNADTNLQNQINTLSAEISTATTRAGNVTCDASGNFSITFTPAFANGVAYATFGTWNASSYPIWILVPTVTTSLSLTTWTGMAQQENGLPVPNAVSTWYAIGW